MRLMATLTITTRHELNNEEAQSRLLLLATTDRDNQPSEPRNFYAEMREARKKAFQARTFRSPCHVKSRCVACYCWHVGTTQQQRDRMWSYFTRKGDDHPIGCYVQLARADVTMLVLRCTIILQK